jgi:hypothetical protein
LNFLAKNIFLAAREPEDTRTNGKPPMNEEEIARIVRSLLEELKNPERDLSTIATDFRECAIDFAVIGSLAVRVRSQPRLEILPSRGLEDSSDNFDQPWAI